MISKTTEIVNKMGFHMRPANMFVTEMAKYSSEITLTVNGSSIDGKSIMSIMAAGIKYKTKITVSCSGEDEKEMLEKAVSMIHSGFGE